MWKMDADGGFMRQDAPLEQMTCGVDSQIGVGAGCGRYINHIHCLR